MGRVHGNGFLGDVVGEAERAVVVELADVGIEDVAHGFGVEALDLSVEGESVKGNELAIGQRVEVRSAPYDFTGEGSLQNRLHHIFR